MKAKVKRRREVTKPMWKQNAADRHVEIYISNANTQLKKKLN